MPNLNCNSYIDLAIRADAIVQAIVFSSSEYLRDLQGDSYLYRQVRFGSYSISFLHDFNRTTRTYQVHHDDPTHTVELMRVNESQLINFVPYPECLQGEHTHWINTLETLHSLNQRLTNHE